MYEDRTRKLRSDETWAVVRRAWEAGETGAALARRYDVGLSNLWRRRASEGWERRETEDPTPEPVEGWNRYARRKLAEFDARQKETRALAVTLAEAMAGGTLEGVPLWHVGFVLRWRAGQMGPEAAAQDRAYLSQYDWTGRFWNTHGRLWPLEDLDAITMEANREAWREDAGLPEGVAPEWP